MSSWLQWMLNHCIGNIRQDDALRAVQWALNDKSQLELSQQTYILEALECAMEKVIFGIMGTTIVNNKGIGMGAKYAPSVANLFLSKWEYGDIFGKFRTELEVYKRYIDDIIIVWKASEDSLKATFKEININAYNIFTGEWNQQQTIFSDLAVYKKTIDCIPRHILSPLIEMGTFPDIVATIPGELGAYPRDN